MPTLLLLALGCPQPFYVLGDGDTAAVIPTVVEPEPTLTEPTGTPTPPPPEPEPNEVEPNDSWDKAQPYPGVPVLGSLDKDDIDCFQLQVGACESVVAALAEPCHDKVQFSLYGADGELLESGENRSNRCVALWPEQHDGVRLIPAGTVSVCVEGERGEPVPGYTLILQTADGSPYLGGNDPDLDGDGLYDSCDDDIDGDGIANDQDNCPIVPNGPLAVPFTPSADGYLRDWITLAPLVGLKTDEECLPSDFELTPTDQDQAPRIGDTDAGLVWTATLFDDDRLDFRGFGGGTPREVYLHSYVYSTTTRDVTLALGPDDGARAWLGGTEVVEIETCGNASPDEVLQDVTLQAGWNNLTVKVRNKGGGWALYARFLTQPEEGRQPAPITDLEIALTPDLVSVPDQADNDGDGIGDYCDPTP